MRDRDDEFDLDESDDLDEEDGDSGETMPCPHCFGTIYDDSERCPHCGEYLSREDAPAAAPVVGHPGDRGLPGGRLPVDHAPLS